MQTEQKRMKLSIIVPVYKVRSYLQRCIESILQQTYTDYELILVDDGSPDGCGAICDRFAQECDKVKVIHKKHGGMSSARNAGIAAAKGEYITFVNGKDIVASGTYYYNMGLLQSRPDVDILEFPIINHYETPKSEIISFNPEKVTGNGNIFKDWVRRKGYEHIQAWNKIFRADLFMFVRYPENESFADTLITPTLYENSYSVYYSDCGFYYSCDHKVISATAPTFRAQYHQFRNLTELYTKTLETYKMSEEANEILLKCVNALTTLYRCKGEKKEEYRKAGRMLKGKRISIASLYRMDISPAEKLKYTMFALFGANIHSKIFAIFQKKLC